MRPTTRTTMIEKEASGALLVRLLLLVVAMASIGVFGATAKPAHATTTFTVDSTGDGADVNLNNSQCDASMNPLTTPCTLRAAIQEANDTPGADVIRFEIGGGSGVKTITPDSRLPRITRPVVINGYSQPGADPNTLATGTNADLKIELSGEDLVGDEEGLFFQTPCVSLQIPNCVVKGLVINRFGGEGILLSTSSGNIRVEGNFIGTNPEGTVVAQDLGNGQDGVGIASTAGNNNTIGGDTPAARNLISGNDLRGVDINTDNNAVVGNLIGTDASGSEDLGNFFEGVEIQSNGNNNIVSANTIAFNGAVNGLDGVSIQNGTGNSVLTNSIFSNDGLGLDLGVDGPTPNDPGDGDDGPNELQNKPNLTSAVTSAGTTAIEGRLNSTPDETFTIQYFSNPPGTDEGKTFLGKKDVTTGSDGLVSFRKKVSPAVNEGREITATATDSEGNTSEFSAPETVE